MVQAPWASGPGEILQHGLSLLRRDSDVNRRLAMLSIDNSVELMVKTYLGLPRRVTGIALSRKDYQEMSESFPALLDALERYAADRLDGINLGEIEWFHRLRNELYHQGNGLTVERDKVEVYAQLAKLLFKNLFGVDLEVREEGTELLGRFMESWARLEQAAVRLVEKQGRVKVLHQPLALVRDLEALGIIDRHIAQEIDGLRRIRNEIVHGKSDYRTTLTQEMVDRLGTLTQQLERRLAY